MKPENWIDKKDMPEKARNFFDWGYAAAFDTYERESNPYPANTQRFFAWDAGWRMGRIDGFVK